MIGKRLSLEGRKSLAGYLFIIPFLVGFTFLFAIPIAKSVMFSLSNITVGKDGYILEYVGFQHFYDAIFVHPDFNRTFLNSILDMFLRVPLIIIFSFFTASILNQKFHGRTIARVIYFLPVILASGVVMKIDNLETISQVLLHSSASEGSLANQALKSFDIAQYLYQVGFSPSIITYILDAINSIYVVISASGIQILVFLAALQSIPPSLFEASNIEGASAWENFWKISFPMISPYIVTNVVYSIIDNFTAYNNGVMNIIDSTTGQQLDYGYGTAMAWIYFITIAIILLIVVRFISKRVFYYE